MVVVVVAAAISLNPTQVPRGKAHGLLRGCLRKGVSGCVKSLLGRESFSSMLIVLAGSWESAGPDLNPVRPICHSVNSPPGAPSAVGAKRCPVAGLQVTAVVVRSAF